MTTAPKVSSCVDCGLALIGERLRCPACHTLHANALIATPLEGRLAAGTLSEEDTVTSLRQRLVIEIEDDAAITSPRDRVAHDGLSRGVARWVLGAEIVFIVVVGSILGMRSCLL